MKLLAVIIAVAVLALASASAFGKGTDTISITGVRDSSHRAGVHVVSYYLLYNKRLGPYPIGNAVIVCQNIGTKTGPFRRIANYCWGTYSISSNGSLQVEGVRRTPYLYQFAITGGTGQYFAAGGQLTTTVYSIRPRRELLRFNYVKGA